MALETFIAGTPCAAADLNDNFEYLDVSTPEDLSSYLLGGFSIFAGGVFEIARAGKLRVIRGYISGTFAVSPSVTTTFTNPLPAGDRPSNMNAFSFAYLAAGNPGSAFIRTNGELAITNMSGSSRSNGQFTIVYTVAA